MARVGRPKSVAVGGAERDLLVEMLPGDVMVYDVATRARRLVESVSDPGETDSRQEIRTSFATGID